MSTNRESCFRQQPFPSILFCGDVSARAGASLPPRRLAEYELVYFPQGTGTVYRTNKQTIKLSESGYILTRPDEEHTYDFDLTVPTRHQYIHFEWIDIPDHDHSQFLREASFLPVLNPIAESLLKQILKLGSTKPKRWIERGNKLLGVILEELSDAYEEWASGSQASGTAIPLPLQTAITFMENQLHRPITVAELSHASGWTHAHFTRQVRRYIGLTPQMLIVHRRIERSCLHLLYENWTVKQVAFACGFQDEHYFSRCFHRIKGMTPSRFREAYSSARSINLAAFTEPKELYPFNTWINGRSMNGDNR
ncbi:AraC family transcriptional regulator [Paenibacillus spongiae]|uniref:AraC family transcriptional regulator n=1 Tax=Paenibacillus spongiae TaxID=2909671 RepID=A0ABY5S5F9_9BACL|nr:AraC family transcriptional regulator [Paenibacillus spongiae]UVI27978.1 AraC family transcriptional regulator [Paenibacillus spongiae]